MAKIKIGFLGAGYIAGVHASVLARDERTRVAAVFDVKRECAEQLARSTGAQVAHSVAEVLALCDAGSGQSAAVHGQWLSLSKRV